MIVVIIIVTMILILINLIFLNSPKVMPFSATYEGMERSWVFGEVLIRPSYTCNTNTKNTRDVL